VIELEQLRRFVALVDARSFTTAATDLRMSQPALSQSIARLERDLGCEVVARNRRHPGVGVIPTPAGEALYADATDVLAAARRLEARARRQDGTGASPRLAVGFSPGVPRRLVSAALGGSGDAVEVSAVQVDWGREHDALLDGTVDVLIHQYPQGARLAGCELFGLLRVPRVALLPSDHRLAALASLSLADLAGEPILDPGFADGPPGFRDLWLGLPRPVGAPLGPVMGPPNRTVDEMFAFVAAHRGMALTSHTVSEEHQRPDVVALAVDDLEALEVGVGVLTEDNRPAVRATVARVVAAAA
jgi:DNA-binding transcriptional LysR family regulator